MDKDVKKRSDVSKRKEDNKNVSFHIIKMKLNTFSKNNEFKDFISKTVVNMNKMKNDAYHLINFHILRCLENNLKLPNLEDQNFYYNCLSKVSKFQLRKETINKDELFETFILYMNNLENISYRDYSGALMNNLSLQLKTSVINHIVLNFSNRLKRYCFFKV